MKNFNLKLNEIIVVKYDDVIYRCSIQGITENSVSINVPVNNGELLMLNGGEVLDVQYCSETGNYYEFELEVIGRNNDDNIPMYNLSLPRNLRKIQRRDYVRVEVLRNIKYRRKEEESWREAIMLDISGGGMRIKVPIELDIGDRLITKFESSGKLFEIEVEIKRNEKVNAGEYIYGLEFIDINEKRRDNIIEDVFFVMRRQREII